MRFSIGRRAVVTGTGRGMVPPVFDPVAYMEKRAAADQSVVVSPAPAQAVVDELKRLRAERDEALSFLSLILREMEHVEWIPDTEGHEHGAVNTVRLSGSLSIACTHAEYEFLEDVV